MQEDFGTDDIAFECREADLVSQVGNLLYDTALDCEGAITELIGGKGDESEDYVRL